MGEVARDRARRDVGGGGDLRDRRLREALAVEQVERRAGDRPRACGRACARAGRARARRRRPCSASPGASPMLQTIANLQALQDSQDWATFSGMSELLARLARSLTHHWKRGLAGAVIVIVLLGAAAGAGGEAADDFSIPGTESQQALDLFKAHSPAFAGGDSTLVFSVSDGRIDDAEPKAAVTGALDKVRELDGVEQVADPFARGRRALARRQARRGRRPLLDRAAGPREGRRRGAARRGRDRRERRRRRRRARHPDRPRLRAGGAGRRADRRRHRDHPADAAVPLARGDGRDAGRRAARRDGRARSCSPRSPSRSACRSSRP